MKKRKAKEATVKADNKSKAPKPSDSSAGRGLNIHRPRVFVKKVRYVVEAVPDQYSFYLHDGKTIKNLSDLIHALDSMPDEIFYYHANDQKNDFSNWIRDIISEHELATSISGRNRLDTKKEIIRFLRKRGAFKG